MQQSNGNGLEMVRAEQIVKRFGRLTVLDGVDLSVKRKQVVVVIGPSGSGKTTLLRCINHLEKIDSGRIYIDGQLVGYREVKGRLVEDKEAAIARMRSQVGFVFQRFNLFPHLTALENVTEAPIHVLHQPREEVKERAMALLTKVGHGAADARGTRGQASCVPRQTLGRAAATRRHRAGSGDGAARDAF